MILIGGPGEMKFWFIINLDDHGASAVREATAENLGEVKPQALSRDIEVETELRAYLSIPSVAGGSVPIRGLHCHWPWFCESLAQ